MKQNIRPGIIFGIIGGLLTFLFGGWSVAVIGLLMGAGLGLALGSQVERKGPWQIAKRMLPTALASALVLLALSLLQAFVVDPAIGRRISGIGIVIAANV